ncbi:MAG: hypothetical protein ACI3YD_08970 [Alloprevotella sp.]
MNIKQAPQRLRHGLGLATILLLAAGLFVSLARISRLKQERDELQARLRLLEDKESGSYIVERISKQMEDIAYQQKDISDKQREEAVFQMGVAENMRKKAEAEQTRANEETQKAQAYARNAAEARNMAERQRSMAEEQREMAVTQQRLAEHARGEADTLSYVAMGRSLASLSLMQHQGGNYDLASLLAYSAWKFTTDYHGNLFFPAVFNALTVNSGCYESVKLFKGGISRIVPLPAGGFASASRYGEMARWDYGASGVHSQLLLSDPSFDFRDLHADADGRLYALDINGRLVIVSPNGERTDKLLPIPGGLTAIRQIAPYRLLLSSDRAFCFYDTRQGVTGPIREYPQPVSCFGWFKGALYVFGKEDGLWRIDSEGSLHATPRHVDQRVTAFACDDENRHTAVGTEQGHLFIVDKQGEVTQRLVGHRSRITQLEFVGDYLISSSYDGDLKLLNLRAGKFEPLTLHSFPTWVHCFYMAPNNILWAGDENGSLSRLVVSPNGMAELIRQNLRRDFTDEEWNFYIGANVPRSKLQLFP